MKELSEKQTQAATLTAPQIMVLAGPGSGKTHTTISRILHVTGQGANPKRMVAITFTVAAAKEIHERLGIASDLGYVGTLHGWCLRIIQKKFSESLVVIGEEDATAVLKEKAAAMKYRGSFEALLEMKSGRKKIPSPTSTEALVLKAYRRELREAQLIDFDSILELAHQVLSADPMAAACDYLFVDEYQDSGTMDAKIYSEVRAKKFFVGDPDQAIYGFRGGSIQAILDAARSPAWIQIYLDDNYRSGRTICLSANRLIAFNSCRVDKLLKPVRKEEGACDVRTFKNDAEEMRWLVKELMSYHDRHQLDDCAVLCRTNMMAQKISATLGTMGMHTRAKHDVLPEDWHLARAMALFYMRPEDNRLAWNYLMLRDGKAEADQKRLTAAAQHKTINQQWLGAQACSPGGLPTMLRSAGISHDSVALVDEAVSSGANSSAEVSAALLSVARQEREKGSGVTVTTIHGFKGREANVVFLPGWEQETMPGKKSGIALEEERRLAFVAVTRARDRVAISHAAIRSNPYTGKPENRFPSQFISELGI